MFTIGVIQPDIVADEKVDLVLEKVIVLICIQGDTKLGQLTTESWQKMKDREMIKRWNDEPWKSKINIAWVENAGVENARPNGQGCIIKSAWPARSLNYK